MGTIVYNLLFPDLLVSLCPLLPSLSLYHLPLHSCNTITATKSTICSTCPLLAAHLCLLFFCHVKIKPRYEVEMRPGQLAPTLFLTEETRVFTANLRLIPSGLNPLVLCLLIVSFTGSLPFLYFLNYVSSFR